MRAVLPLILLSACASSYELEPEPPEVAISANPECGFEVVIAEWERYAPPVPDECRELEGDGVHKQLHALLECLHGDPGYDHAQPGVWAGGGPGTVEARALAACGALQAP